MKGQTETIGLMIIVVLLLFLGIIFLSFALREKQDFTPEVRTSLQTTSLLTALLQTTVDNQQLKESFQNCYVKEENCLFLANETSKILDLAIQPGQNYNFTLSAEDKQLLSIGKCSKGAISQTSVRRGNTDFTVQLRLC